MTYIKLETVGSRIKYVRKQLRKSQLQFAGELKVSNKTISDVENGKNNPNFDLTSKLRSVFNVNLDFIVLGTGDPFVKEDKGVCEISKRGVIKHQEILLNTELRNFLDHLLNSRTVRLEMLKTFSTFFRHQHQTILNEMEESREEQR